MKTQVCFLVSFACLIFYLYIFKNFSKFRTWKKTFKDGMALISKIFNTYLAEMKSLIYCELTTIHFVNG